MVMKNVKNLKLYSKVQIKEVDGYFSPQIRLANVSNKCVSTGLGECRRDSISAIVLD